MRGMFEIGCLYSRKRGEKYCMDIVYLQADMRYNNWLLETINNKNIIEYTLDKIRELGCGKIVAGIYICNDNRKLVELLKKKGGVELELSRDENVNSRFVDLMLKEEAEYIIRVGGDQIFLDIEKTIHILKEMKRKNKDFFYHSGLSSVLPDIVSMDCLEKWKINILDEDRYFKYLEKETSIDRYTISYPCTLLYDYRVNSNERYRICKNIIEKKLDIYDLSQKLAEALRAKDNYLNQTGIWGSWILGNSSEDFFKDESGMVNPWWGSSVIELVLRKLNKNMKVFEWGAGNSTLFWSQYVEKVVTVESDYAWYKKMKEVVPDNVRLEYCELEYNGEYCRKILGEKERFDIILIDGRDRVKCAFYGIDRLTENGVIIWDNTERDYYREGYDFLKKHGFKQLELSSIVYGLPGVADYTSIFYRKNNVLEL